VCDWSLVSWQDEFLRLVAERDEARADQRVAIDRGDLPAAASAAHICLQAELALEELRVKRREQHKARPRARSRSAFAADE